MANATGPSYGRLDSEFGLEVSGAAGPASACTRSMAERCRIILRACRGGPRPAALDAIFEETSSPCPTRHHLAVAALDVASGLVIGKCYKRHQGDRVSGLPQAHRRQRAARSRCSHHH